MRVCELCASEYEEDDGDRCMCGIEGCAPCIDAHAEGCFDED